MMQKANLLASGARIAGRHKRYVVWFYLLNLMLALAGGASFRSHAHAILDHSLYADRLLHGFDAVAFFEMLARAEMRPANSSTLPGLYFALLFLFLSMLLLPGVLQGYAVERRLPREEFFRSCGLNIWRSIRLFLFFLVVAGLPSGLLLAAQTGILKAAENSSHERLPFLIKIVGLGIIFLVVTFVRIWFDLAQTDVVVRDQGAVRRSIAEGFRRTKQNVARLLGTYTVIAAVAGVVLALGIVVWIKLVPPSSVFGAFLVGQLTLVFLLFARFWQRACAVSFYLQQRNEPIFQAIPPVASTVFSQSQSQTASGPK